MKKILFLCMLAVLAAAGTYAQDSTAVKKQHDHQHMGKGHHGMPLKQLNLSQDQHDKISAIHKDEKAKTAAIKSNTALSDADKKQQLKTLHDTNRKAVAAVLTPEQKTKLKELNKEHRHSPKNRGASPNDSTRVNR